MNSHQRRKARRATTNSYGSLTKLYAKGIAKLYSPERCKELMDIWKEFMEITDDPETTSKWRTIGTPTMPAKEEQEP